MPVLFVYLIMVAGTPPGAGTVSSKPMKRIFYFISIVLLLTSCNNESSCVSTKINSDNFSSRFSILHSLFKDTLTDTLYVYSAWSLDEKDFAFKGVTMDSLQVSLLPTGIKDNWRWNKDFGACCKFPLDKSNIALICRTSGEYVSTALKLFIFNLDRDSIINTINLADSWGDAGEASVYSSCIFKENDKNLLILTYYWATYDHGMGDVEQDTIVENWKYYYLYKLSDNKLDTLTKDSTEIVNRYPGITKKLASY